MTPFETVRGVAAPLLRPNIDTDTIIRVEHMTASDQSTLGDHAFEVWRIGANGLEDGSFVLNQPRYRTAAILLAGENFGCGSSREHAVSALLGRGIKVVIAPSFGDTFYNNCFQQGLLPIRLPADAIARIAEEAATDACTSVDLESQVIRSPSGREYPFEIEAMRRKALLTGMSDIEASMALSADIARWQSEDRRARLWLWNTERQD